MTSPLRNKSQFSLPRLALMAGMLVVFQVPLPAQQVEWTLHKTPDNLHPSPIEQQMLWLMNRARANPPAEGSFLAATGDETIGFYLDYFGVKINLLRSEFNAIKPAPPAAFDRRLWDASRKHSEYLISIDSQVHTGQDVLLNQSGFNWSTARLSVFSYGESGLQAHAALNIDYGPSDTGMQVGRGHRAAIMANLPGPVLSNVGLAVVPDNNPLTEVGPDVFSGAYAAAVEGSKDGYNRFVVGTVWNDTNKNKMYDEGEGLSDVKVELDHGGWYARTGVAGGYAIPVTEAGDYILSFSGPKFPKTHSRALTVGNVSVLADAEMTSLPASISIPFTSSIRIDSAGAVVLTWSGGQGPYQVQSTHSLDGAWQNVGTPIQDHSITLPRDGSGCFYRVRDGG